MDDNVVVVIVAWLVIVMVVVIRDSRRSEELYTISYITIVPICHFAIVCFSTLRTCNVRGLPSSLYHTGQRLGTTILSVSASTHLVEQYYVDDDRWKYLSILSLSS